MIVVSLVWVICSVSLFAATKQEAREYYEKKYAKELEQYRRTGEFGSRYDEYGRIKPLTMSDIEEWSRLSELGLLDKTTEIKLGNFDSVPVSWEIYYEITDNLATISDENERFEMENRYAIALSYSRNFDLPFHCALENLDEIAEAWSKVEYAPTPTKGREIFDSIHNFFDDDYVTTWEAYDAAQKTQDDFEAFINSLRENWFEF